MYSNLLWSSCNLTADNLDALSYHWLWGLHPCQPGEPSLLQTLQQLQQSLAQLDTIQAQ